MNIWGKRIAIRGKGQNKAPKVGACLVCSGKPGMGSKEEEEEDLSRR